ncbi:hypothetical protein AUC68_13725 [Methyloceanibacter methanicus]|uniref:FecR protein domain-containing protein n=1 Tax=Methyloceanibacter methanicus TaxID=1774968 RepID=A0A1E3W587_9HYPH|nr:FecR domain-containing protein [Methyloceanibacter methanicus]ODS00973.1 hypothetical protein AUC68_13725 [Methyloceanibacter methanicus]
MGVARAIGAFLVVCAAIVSAPQDGAANKVGVAAAVNPDAFFGAGGARKELRIGKSIFYNERISTDANGVVQVLLVDGSTFTVGRNSDVVIDRFVYDPNKKTGEVVATFSKGSMRFIGGKISKNPGGVTVNTPEGSLAIRGGMFQGTLLPGGSIFSFLYGREMTFRGLSGKVYSVYQPGYSLVLGNGTPAIRPTTPADIQTIMTSLTNSAVNPTSANTEGQPPAPQYVFTLLNLQQLVSDATSTQITDEILRQVLARRIPVVTVVTDETITNTTTPPSTTTPSTTSPSTTSTTTTPTTAPSTTDVTDIKYTIGAYGSGLIQSTNLNDYGFATSISPSDFSYNEDTRVITLTLHDIEGGSYVQRAMLTFTPTSAYNWSLSALSLYNNSGDAIPTTSSSGFIEQQTGSLCSNCEFIKWGTFGTEFTYNQYSVSEYPVTEGVDLGWWVGGQVTAFQDLPVTGTASYAGTAIGSITNYQLDGPVVGTGNLGMTWNFAQRSGAFAVTNFNANSAHGLPDLNVGGTMTMPGNVNQFSGAINGAAGQTAVSGGAHGSFVTDGRRPAAGVIGNWGVSGANGYRATGIFGGVSKP